MFSFQNIYQCYRECRKHKTNALNTLHFEADLIENLWKLHRDLNTCEYRIGKSICFLTRSPKLREVFAADFRDRIVHHILVRALEPFYEKRFIHDVYNNRKARGTHMAVKRAQSFMKRHGQGYYLQLDIKGFFYNLDKNILFKKIFDDLSGIDMEHKKEILWLTNKIIYHNPTKNYVFKGDMGQLHALPSHKSLFKLPPNKGLAIGNLTSQFFANVYMNGFDNYVKRTLKVKSYLRYVDDFVLFDSSKERLLSHKASIEEYLRRFLGLTLRVDSKLQRFDQGLDFLGYVIRPNYLLVRNRVVNNLKYKKAKFYDYYENGGDTDLKPISQYKQVLASFQAHAKHANAYRLTKKIQMDRHG